MPNECLRCGGEESFQNPFELTAYYAARQIDIARFMHNSLPLCEYKLEESRYHRIGGLLVCYKVKGACRGRGVPTIGNGFLYGAKGGVEILLLINYSIPVSINGYYRQPIKELTTPNIVGKNQVVVTNSKPVLPNGIGYAGVAKNTQPL